VARAEAYLHAKFRLDPSNRLATVHERHRQDRQRTDSLGRTILQTVAQKIKVIRREQQVLATDHTTACLSMGTAVRKLKERPVIDLSLLIIRPHRSTTFVDAAYCYERGIGTVVCVLFGLSVCRSVCHDPEPCKNG